jgi:lysophospholipase L1-like esterase
MSVPTGGSQLGGRDFGPICVEGIAVADHDIAVLGCGDSLIAGGNDTSYPNGSDGLLPAAGGGWLQRALINCNGRSVPFLQMGYSGTQVFNLLPNMAKRRMYFPYVTHAIENHGTNDATNSRTEAQIYADRKVLWSALRGANSSIRRVEANTIYPRTGSTDTWTTTANQTPNANGWATGGAFRDPMNADLITARSQGLIHDILDFNSVLADPTLPDRWVVTGGANYATTDGTHPSPALHVLMANIARSRIATWS